MKVAETVIQNVPVAKIELSNAVQMRPFIDRMAVQDYAEAMERGEEFPPIVVFHRQGGPMYVADGFHRVLAAQRAKLKTIRAEVRDGAKRDAILYAAGANRSHGVRRTLEYIRRSVTTILQDKEWRKWTDTEIAKTCQVSAPTVRKYRELLNAQSTTRTYLDEKGLLRTTTVRPRSEQSERSERSERCPYCRQNLPSGFNHPNQMAN